jgi:TolB-like protein/tetratricopeptide (TPR) repeat protein
MMNLLAQLKQRQMFRVAAAYAVVAWLLIQLVNNLAPMLRLPEWAGSFFLVLLLIGFPVVLIFAWVHELESASEDGALARVKTGKLDWTLIGALIIVIGLVSYQQLASNNTATAEKQPGVEAAKAAAASPAGTISLAVLPFSNLSGDPSQEFFSDGMTEEITSALARVPDLRVVGRTSAFQFKGEKKDLRSIGQALNATHLIEGSVRKAGERVRITVQLIKAEDGTNMWSENYDRELIDVFAIQEEIGRAIATSFNMRLGLAPGENLVSNRTENSGVYQEFLQGKAWLRARLSPASGPYLETFESVVARDPSFAPAWVLLTRAYALEPGQNREVIQAVNKGSLDDARRLVKSFLDKGELAGQKAIELDPQNSGGYWGLSQIIKLRGQWAAAEDYAKKALELDPNDPDALGAESDVLFKIGHLRQSLPLLEKARALDPLVIGFNNNAAKILLANGQVGAAIARLESIPATVGRRNMFLARAYAAQGRYGEAADTLLSSTSRDPDFRRFLEDNARLLRSAPAKVAAPQSLPENMSEYNFVYAHIGAIDRAMEYAERELEIGYLQDVGNILWFPDMAPLRKTERFKAYMRNVGLVDYWKARGWPDLCKPVGANDFACE